jgi:hypothetical protein
LLCVCLRLGVVWLCSLDASAATFSVVRHRADSLAPTRSPRHSNCKEATCEGGACVFERVEDVKCPGGACQFRNMHRTLSEGYCTGGGCRLDGEAHPTDFAATLSE